MKTAKAFPLKSLLYTADMVTDLDFHAETVHKVFIYALLLCTRYSFMLYYAIDVVQPVKYSKI